MLVIIGLGLVTNYFSSSDEDVVYTGRILRERKRHKWGDYQAVLTARALYLFNREYVSFLFQQLSYSRIIVDYILEIRVKNRFL